MISRQKKGSEEIAVCDYVVDTVAELDELPTLTTGNSVMGWNRCLHGSTAICWEDGKLYAIRGNDRWKKVGEA